MNNSKYIFFDIDGTLTEGNLSSWDYVTLGLGLKLEVHHGILKQLGKKELSLQKAIDELSIYWRSSKKASLPEFLSILDSIKLRKNTNSVINELTKKGHKSVLLTGSMDVFANLLTKKLCAHEFLTSSYVIWEKDNFKSFHYELDQSKSKLRQLMKYLKLNNIEKSNCVMVGNGDNDIDVFKYLDLSFCLIDTSEDETRKYAKYTISDLSEILNYLK